MQATESCLLGLLQYVIGVVEKELRAGLATGNYHGNQAPFGLPLHGADYIQKI